MLTVYPNGDAVEFQPRRGDGMQRARIGMDNGSVKICIRSSKNRNGDGLTGSQTRARTIEMVWRRIERRNELKRVD